MSVMRGGLGGSAAAKAKKALSVGRPLSEVPLSEVLASALVSWHVGRMKRIGILAFYAVSTLAILYLALYAYAVYRGRDFTPGDPIHIFRNPAAPSYS
jgi:hypothetical protein